MNYKLIGLIVAAVIGLILLSAVVLGKRKNVVQGFEGVVATEGGDGGKFVMYYADWCPHCTTAKPAFQEFSKDGKVVINGKEVHVRMLEADKNKDEMKGLHVKGYPTFLLETMDGKVIEYKGPRETDKYLEFLNKQLGGGI
jgi:thiol-disulfide isomerase/thioredoxin